MSIACVPITWLRSTAVCALASSTIACTSGRVGDAEVLGDAGGAARPLDVAALDHQLEHRVARPGVDALGDEDVADHQVRHAVRVAGDDRVDRRVLDALGDVDDRAVPRHARRAVDRVGPDRRALVDHDDLHPDALLAQLLRLGLDACRSPAGTSVRRSRRR